MRQSLAYDEDVGDFSPPSATNENLTCDLLVAGGGLSGLSAADAAIRRGLNVVVVEKGIYGKEAASGLSAGQFLTGWAKSIEVMIAELAQQDRQKASKGGQGLGGRGAGCGDSWGRPVGDASGLENLIATITCAPQCNMAHARRR